MLKVLFRLPDPYGMAQPLEVKLLHNENKLSIVPHQCLQAESSLYGEQKVKEKRNKIIFQGQIQVSKNICFNFLNLILTM
jgi:hypothetical protein